MLKYFGVQYSRYSEYSQVFTCLYGRYCVYSRISTYCSYSQYSRYLGLQYCSYSGIQSCSYSKYSQCLRRQYCSYSKYSQYWGVGTADTPTTRSIGAVNTADTPKYSQYFPPKVMPGVRFSVCAVFFLTVNTARTPSSFVSFEKQKNKNGRGPEFGK